jgi:ATP-binding protein involved in chromosome partitioning
MAEPNVDVEAIDVDRERRVTIRYMDGRECTFDLHTLRVNCPCAGCRNDRDEGRIPWPRPTSPQPLRIDEAHLVGNWGLGITWNDGHDTGIYPWDGLRHWCDRGDGGAGTDGGIRTDGLG